MTKTTRATLAGLAGTLALAFVLPAAVSAADKPSSMMSAMSNDCKTASATMMNTQKMPAMTSMGSVDKNYAQMMEAHMKAMSTLMKMEMKCGSDAKAKADAQAEMARMAQIQADLDRIMHTP